MRTDAIMEMEDGAERPLGTELTLLLVDFDTNILGNMRPMSCHGYDRNFALCLCHRHRCFPDVNNFVGYNNGMAGGITGGQGALLLCRRGAPIAHHSSVIQPSSNQSQSKGEPAEEGHYCSTVRAISCSGSGHPCYIFTVSGTPEQPSMFRNLHELWRTPSKEAPVSAGFQHAQADAAYSSGSPAGAVPAQEVAMPPRGRTLWIARRGDSPPRPFRSGCSLPLGLTKGPDDLGGTHCLSGRSSRPRKFINELILERVCRKGKDAGGSGRETRMFLIEGGPELPQIQAFRASASQCLPACKPFRANPSAQNFSSAKEVSEEDRNIGGGQRDLDLGIWMLAHIGNLMVAGDSKGTEEMLALTMGSIEQTAQDGGKWEVG